MIEYKVRKKLDTELDLGLSLSKALGNLRYLAKSTNTEGDTTLSITQGMAILDALHAVELAVKSRQKLIDMENGKV